MSKKEDSSKETKSRKKEIEKGDFVYVDYIGLVRDSKEIFDTTIEEEAKKAGIYRENERYEPILLIVGEKWIVEGVDESLVGKKEGEHYEIEVSPDKGFGLRDSKKIVTTSIRKLQRSGLKGDIRPGMVIEVNGMPAIVRAVVSGRVMLDFNPPLAGKYLIYKIWIRKIVKGVRNKIIALIKKNSNEIVEKSTINIKKNIVEINLKDLTIEKPELGRVKKRIVEDILKYIEQIEGVRFIEEVIREVHEKAPETKEVQPQQE